MNEATSLAFERPILEMESKVQELKSLAASTKLNLNGEVVALEERLHKVTSEVYARLTPWERVNVARHPSRPVAGDYIDSMFEDFIELHGDRLFSNDPAILTGFGFFEGRRVLLVAHRKGKTVKERLLTNFGCAHPEGYRKALEKMRLAEKLGLPIVTMINTPGAYPGIGAEERGQARAIAYNIREMFGLRVPVVCLVIGEGGSGGALGIGVGDRVGILEYAYYSVISPEGCAAILWKSGDKTPEAADALKLSAPDLLDLGIVDELIEEPLGGAHRAPKQAIENVRIWLRRQLDELSEMDPDELLLARQAKFRDMGVVDEPGSA
ncbi:MAG: acetyl-CoA carboxylase carboxyl transferase subunit alpha [Planctomycetota bacterium]|nr:MAG: acetyl-CoA carboxylase carboxyl transferase subunit alpha [Planctomycetota bacterium]